MENGIKRKSATDDGVEAETLQSSAKTEEYISQNGNSSQLKEKPLPQHRSSNIPLHLKTARVTLYVLSKALNIVYVPVFIYRVFEKRRKCTPVTDPILRIPAVELARRIRKREISCQQVIQTYISRIQEVNPLINAVIDDRFVEALEDAKRVDELVARDCYLNDPDRLAQEYPLLGVPVTVKGSLAVKGMKHTSGTVTRKEYRAEDDATAVALARKAGAIPMLVSNVPELCMSWETSNKLIGTTRNPHDTTRTCGGSSGGEGSLLASGASVIGIGSDVAGSLRLPAHFCGIWGHKPTPGTVSYEGHYPSCPNRERWESVFTVGPMARYATDLRVLLTVISEPDKREALDLNRKIDVKKIRIYYSEHEDFYWKKPNENCQRAVNQVVDHFRNICRANPTKIDLHLSQNVPDLAALDILSIEDIEDIFDGNANGVFSELVRYTTFRSRYTFMAIACGVLRKIATSLSDTQKDGIKKYLTKLKKEFGDLLKDDGVFIVPSFPTEAHKHGDVLRTALHYGYMSMFNGLGFPVTNCPVRVTSDGLPVGVQVVSLPYGDNLTLTAAEEIEKAFGGWIEPSGRV